MVETLKDIAQGIENVIDRGIWKHSWHLPKNEYGHTDWCCAETESRCHELLLEAQQEATDFLARVTILLGKIDWEYYRKRKATSDGTITNT
jgi:hypothetical protein